MKKRLSLVFAALMALSMIAGCGASNSGSKDAAQDTSAAPATSAQTSAASSGTVRER